MDLRIFLSSTSEDLAESRQKTLRLLSVIPADLIHMETFGSDETRPVDYCLERVRQCNLFIGVYAERYGAIDPKTGLSLTELEYREALRMLQSNELSGLLVYLLDKSASWKVEYVDRNPAGVNALSLLKEELKKNHTVTFFRDADELPLFVLRDVLRKVGIGSSRILRARTSLLAPPPREFGPLGMEHYTEADANSFRGREEAVAAVCDLVESAPILLLIGDSGIGKTSLIEAGLFPLLRNRGWALASVRPLDDPDRSIPPTIWSCLMEGMPPDANLGTLVELVATAHAGRKVLLVIDQFEDIITELGTPKTASLLSALRRMHTSPIPNLRVVLCYRGDAEPKVGKYWQVVSGSASGLPRYYLAAPTEEGAFNALNELLFSVLQNHGTDETIELLYEIVRDVSLESKRSLGVEVYPPFLQMAAETLFEIARQSKKPVTRELYQSVGGARQIIGRYLIRQLHLMGSHSDECRAILVSLATNRRRLRKSLDSLANETNISKQLVEQCLLNLTNLRMARKIGDAWEITHDFLAQKVFEDLVQPEEREARIFRDVLIAKTAAFDSTGEMLRFKEHLGVYAHRTRISCTPTETELLFAGGLAATGPAHYFLQSMPEDIVQTWAEQRLKSANTTVQRNAFRFLLGAGRSFPLADLVEVFREYKIQAELGRLIKEFAVTVDIPLLLRLRNKKAELVRDAAYEQIGILGDPGDLSLVRKLLGGRKASDLRHLCRLLTDKAPAGDLNHYRKNIQAKLLGKRVAAICALGRYGTLEDAGTLQRLIDSKSISVKEKEVCAFALTHWAQLNKDRVLILKLLDNCGAPCRGVLGALEGDKSGVDVEPILNHYKEFPSESAAAVLRTASKTDISKLRRFLTAKHIDRDMRDIFLALLRAGGQEEARFLLEVIASSEREVYFWNVPILGQAFSEAVDSSAKSWLIEFTESDEFWSYFGSERGKKPLPVKSAANLYLFKRLVGMALPKLCDREDWQLLQRLLFHDYWLIQVAAANRISALADVTDLDALLEKIRREARDEADPGLIYALNLLDSKFYTAPSAGIQLVLQASN